MSKKEKERYKLISGKYGYFFFDNKLGKSLTLNEILRKLNKLHFVLDKEKLIKNE